MTTDVDELLLIVPTERRGERLDRILVELTGGRGLSRARLQGLIRDGEVAVGTQIARDPGRRLVGGEELRLRLPPPEPAAPLGQAMPLDIVFEDAHLIVIDKPVGLVVHPAPGHRDATLVNALIAHCGDSLSGIGGVRRPGIVHRLDKDTSGLLVVAKSDAAHRGLAEQFASHGADGRLVRGYTALVWGVPSPLKGAIDAPIGRSPTSRTRMAVIKRAAARHAGTDYRVADVLAGGLVALVDLALRTGRTHQIRVHLAHIGHPLLGDALYGAGFATRAARLQAEARDALTRLGRQALHAHLLGFEHPVVGRPIQFESRLPEDFAVLVRALGRAPTDLARQSVTRART